MTIQKNQQPKPGTIKDPSEWKTVDEPMTGPQESYLETLAREAGEEVEPDLTKAEASEKIDELQQKTGRGKMKQACCDARGGLFHGTLRRAATARAIHRQLSA